MKLTGGTQQTKREFFEESIFYFDRFIKKNKKEMEKKEVGKRGKAKKKLVNYCESSRGLIKLYTFYR